MSSPAPGVPPAPLHPEILDMLRHNAIGVPGNQSVDQILGGLGLPPLPQFPVPPPLPGLPTLPPLDPVALMRPITDQFGHFGTGNLGMGSINPSQFFSQVSEGLTQVMSLGSTAIGALSALQGAGTQAAVAKAAQAQDNAAAVTQQATLIQSLLVSAAVVVQTGNAELAAIASKLAIEITAAAVTPGGQAFIAAATAEAAAEAAAVVAHVRAELTVLTTQMTAAGQPVPITSPPNPTPSPPTVGKAPYHPVKHDVPPVQPVPIHGKKVVAKPVPPPPKHKAPVTKGSPYHHGAAAAGGVAPMGAAAYGGGPSGAARAPLRAVVTDAPVEPRASAVVRPVGAEATASTELAAGETTAARSGAPMMPMGAGVGARAAELSVASRDYLVNAEHGDEVVGELDDVAKPVVGGPVAAVVNSPDKALTL
ncbi:hypothetical protein KO481_25730 [Nocardia sp. NEAU-G5]|uniref:PPE family domain-containing protein n=1 Tax=Nocardia albiluteola TaxID=2842303 RepID=A0ABS6B6S8_9NOCA|nr:hypothetical protein [Nocardia albiluteola]MBU3064918.1 hypothetical protein [Nocardia albiluteola]